MAFLVQRNPGIIFSMKAFGTKGYLSLNLINFLWNDMFKDFREIIP
jgi:hypothetical protein